MVARPETLLALRALLAAALCLVASPTARAQTLDIRISDGPYYADDPIEIQVR